jgi:hypothetical protein
LCRGCADGAAIPAQPGIQQGFAAKLIEESRLGLLHLPGLGGLRRARPDSVNLGWRNASFRGYADYMQTPEFEQSLDEMVQVANQERIVLMCAEAVPWRCHRSLIADALLVRGIRAEDIMSSTRRHIHSLTPFAKVRGTTIAYPAKTSQTTPKQPGDNHDVDSSRALEKKPRKRVS